MHVHQDQPRVPLLPLPDGRLAVIRALHEKPDGGQQFHQPIPVLELVVHHQYLRNCRAGTDTHHAARRGMPDGYAGVTALDGDVEPEYGALPGGARHREIASHQPRESAADRQPQSGSLPDIRAAPNLAERNSFPCSSSVMPAPVSSTRADSHSWPPLLWPRVTRSPIRPRAVNLMAFPKRLISVCRILPS